MALGGRGLSLGRGNGLVGSDTGLSSGAGGLQSIDFEDGIHLNFAKGVYYVKSARSPANVNSFTNLFTFTRAAPDAYFINQQGVMVAATTNVPRINYTNGVCDGILHERSAQNVALNNGNLGAGTWTKSNCTAASTTSIDGTSRTVRVVEDSANAIHGVIAGMTITANTTYCMSAIVKAQGRNFAFMYGINTDQFGAIFDLANLTATNILSGTSTIAEKGVIPLGGDRFLCYVSGVLNAASTTLNFVGGPAVSNSVPAGYTYQGNGTSGVDMEFIQVELGRFPTSRIVTAGSAVTRAADNSSRTLSTEVPAHFPGTVRVTGRAAYGQHASENQFFFSFDNVGTDRVIFHRPLNTDLARFRIFTATVGQGSIDGTFVNGAKFVASMAWNTNDLALSFNNAAVLTNSSASFGSAPTTLTIGSESTFSQGNNAITSFDYWPERVNNSILRGL